MVRKQFSVADSRPPKLIYPDTLGEREAKVIIERTANDVDQVKRPSFRNRIHSDMQAQAFFLGSQLRQDLRRWLSPPDPSTNHNIACGARHEGTAEWFFQGSIFREWKSTGYLLWVHGKRTFLLPFSLHSRR